MEGKKEDSKKEDIKKEDETVKEVEDQEEPKPSAIPSAPQTASAKPSVIKSATPSREVSQVRTTTAPPESTYLDTGIPEEQTPVAPAASAFQAPQEYVFSPAPSPTQMTDVPGPESLSPSIQQLSESSKKFQSQASRSRGGEATRSSAFDKSKTDQDFLEDFPSDAIPKKRIPSPTGFVGCLTGGLPSLDNFSCSRFIAKRSPFVHSPPRPEERRPRIERPRSPRDYIINLREDLADFQESHGLPRSRDYSFMSLGLALAQETARAICSVFLMFSELFPVIAIISLVLRFALDKLIDILETPEPVPKLKKTLIFCLQMVMILIPLWILIGTIVLPLAGLLFSIFRKLLRFKGGKSGRCSYTRKQVAPAPKKIDRPKAKSSCASSSG